MRCHRTNIARSIALAGSLVIGSEAGAQPVDTCRIPDRVRVGAGATLVEFTATVGPEGQEVLHKPTRLREVKWAASLLFPWLRGRDIAIFLYPSEEAQFLANYEDIATVPNVRFYLACREGDGFRTVPARAARVSRDDAGSAPEMRNQHAFIGLTIPIQDRSTDEVVASYLPADQGTAPRSGEPGRP